ncbi:MULTISPECIES: siphovirus Gp157 family protein [Aerococcus]|uniref:Siphovirus Gp157 family protein n=1 Tax=Aerococcus mictus TaxID=2976810 RepID=A0A1E9PGC5_9LACT|nr:MULTISPECIES: siphovirus Gp157 family protein [Aerococcus]KAA9231683.1 siphovirus Gp157 family protein [Aerococcus mictus]KAA9291230.1 siphovirus Gp157 family protein [Aerococcus mictus]MBU5611151.1 siphovirus Gp157 family protein [Aerococcus urinae]MCY3064941.1 siphovirus Gp157 family protein [Aerococcus mictus]MCY3077336.1 siphovirus Gp157 family protein [Aerococcus mictus]
MNIYELSERYQILLDLLQTTDIENDPEAYQMYQDTLDSINDVFEDKAEGYIKVITELEGDMEKQKNEIDRLTKRKQSYQRNIKRMKQTLQEEMEATGKQKIKTPIFTIWTQNNPKRVVVTDEEAIPEHFLVPQKPKVDKKSVLDYLKMHEGETVDGVTIEQDRGVRYR